MKEYKGVQKQKHFHGLRIMFHIIIEETHYYYRRNSFYVYESDRKSNGFRKNFNIHRKDTIVYNKLKKVFRKYIENMEK